MRVHKMHVEHVWARVSREDQATLPAVYLVARRVAWHKCRKGHHECTHLPGNDRTCTQPHPSMF